MSGRRGERGFTLIELLISLILVGVGLALAAQLLMETSQLMADAAAEQTESALPLARARLRSDIQACRSTVVIPDAFGGIAELRLVGHPAGLVRYRKVGRDLLRDVSAGAGDTGIWEGQTIVLRNVQGWQALPSPPEMVALQIHIRRRAVRRSPLAAVPGARGPGDEERTETLLVAPRGGGLELGW